MQHRRHNGFSLVEILVGMIIGLLGVIVIMQMYSVFDRQKRTTTSGADAQNSGAIALYRLQRDILQSGYGISVLGLLGCDVKLRSGVTLTAIAPVTIYPAGMVSPLIPAGDPNTDSLLVVYGNSNGSPQGDTIKAGGGTTYTMKNTPTSLTSDYVIAEPLSLACTGTNALTLENISSVNTAAKTVTLTTTVSANDGTLFNLGQAPKILAYAIRSGNLTVCDYMVNNCGDLANASSGSVWVPIASDIASMKAQYGKDTVTPAPPTQTSYIVSGTYDQTTPTTGCGWARAPAVRLALVARGAVRGLQAVTTAPSWAGSSGAPVVLTADTNWQRYHYKVFETTVPLRNITWMGVQTGC